MTLCSLSAPLRGRLASFPVLRLPVYQEVDLPLVWLVQDCEFRRSRVERGALCGWSLSVDGALRGGACVSLLPPARLVIRMSRSVYDACGLDARRESGGARGDAPMYTCDVDLRALGGPGAYAPGMRVGFTGDVAINVEELSALVADLTVSTFVVVFAVLAVILAYFRWWPAVPVLAIPLFASTLYAFALVTLPPASIDALNSNTAFLGSVIVGNGVNFGIIFLAR